MHPATTALTSAHNRLREKRDTAVEHAINNLLAEAETQFDPRAAEKLLVIVDTLSSLVSLISKLCVFKKWLKILTALSRDRSHARFWLITSDHAAAPYFIIYTNDNLSDRLFWSSDWATQATQSHKENI